MEGWPDRAKVCARPPAPLYSGVAANAREPGASVATGTTGTTETTRATETEAHEAQPGTERLRGLRGRLVAGFAFALLVLVGLSLFADGRKLVGTLRDFRWWLVAPILLGTTLNYAVRAGKWHYYLGAVGVHDLPLPLSVRIFVAGFSMSITPGKVGEVLKSVLVRSAVGTPFTTTAPIVLAERLTDGVAVLVLAGVGLAVFRYGAALLLGIAALMVAGYLLLLQPGLMRRLIAVGERVPLVRRVVPHAHAFYDTTYRLMAPRIFLMASAVSVFSWVFECVSFFLVLLGLGFAPSGRLFFTATFVIAAATLIGSVSLLPGGLGAAEISVTAMLLALVHDPHMTQDVAIAATLLIRFATLWYGVLLGVLSLFTLRGLLDAPRPVPAVAGEVAV